MSTPKSHRVTGEPREPGAGIVGASLVLRLVLFAAFQGLVALVFVATGSENAWVASAAWWPFTAAATSIVTFLFLRWRASVEGFSMAAMYRPVRVGLGKDLLLALAVAVVGGTLAVVGSIALAPLLFADPLAANELLIRPLPLWAAILAVIVFPVTIALTELPLYFGYAQPRIARLSGSAWVSILLPAIFLSLQHATLPLIFDPAFIAWRSLMFLAFALVLSWSLAKRPRLLPYLIVVHFLLDLQAAISILLVSVG